MIPGVPDRMIASGPGRPSRPLEEHPMETVVGLALVVIAAIEILVITRTVASNLPR